MILGIAGFVFSILNILYTFLGLITEPEIAVSFSIAFSIFSLPLSIVGRVLSSRCIDEGDTSKMASVGASLGLAGIIVSAVALFLGFCALVTI